MGKLKQHKKNGFTIIDNTIIRNKDISLKAKGMMLVLSSLPNGWNFTENGLTSILKESRDSVRTTLKELEKHGYLHRERVRDENGKYGGTDYHLYQQPILEQPIYEKPMYDNPTLDKNTQLNKEVLNKDKSNKEVLNKDLISIDETEKQILRVCELVIEHLNHTLGTNSFRYKAKKNQTPIRARLNDGFKLDDFIRVINYKHWEWQDTDYAKFLRPETLFGNKFDGYLSASFTAEDRERKKQEKFKKSLEFLDL